MHQKRAIYYMCHVLTQLTRNSYFSCIKYSKYLAPTAIESWSLHSWQNFTQNFLESESKLSSFLQDYFNMSRESCYKKIAKLCYDTIKICFANKGSLVILGDQDYPNLLSEIPSRPFAFYLKGSRAPLKKIQSLS